MARNLLFLVSVVIIAILFASTLTDTKDTWSEDQDVATWPITRLKSWLTDHNVDWQKMNIPPEKHEYAALVIHYRRAAREHASLAQAKVEEALNELRRGLEAKKQLKTKNIDKVVDAARAAVVEAQKAGNLDAESLRKAFTIAKNDIVKKKTATAEQWDQVSSEMETALSSASNTTLEQYHAAVKRAQDGLQSLLERVRKELQSKREMSQENIDYVVDQVRKRIESVQDWGSSKVEDETTWFDSIRDDLQKRQAVTADQLQNVMDRLENTYAGYKAAAVDSAKGVYESGQENLQAFIDRVTTNLNQYKDLTKENIDSITTSLRTSLSSLPWREVTPAKEETYLESLRSDLSKRGSLAADRVQLVLDTVRTTMDDFRSAFLAYANAATDTVQAAYSTATSYAGDKATQARDNFASATSIAGDAFVSATSYVGDKASQVTEAFTGATHTAAENIKETGAEANEEVQGVLDGIKKHFQETKEWSADQVNWVVSYVRDSITGAKRSTEQSIESVVDGVRRYLSDTKKASEDEITKISDGIRQDLHAWLKKMPWVGRKDEL